MVAFLSSANVLLEAQHLGPVFAEGAIHGGVAAQHLLHPFLEGVHHQRVLPEIAGGEEVNLGMIRRHPLGVLTDAAHQNTRKQEVRNHHDAVESQLHQLPKARFNQGEGHA